MNWKNTLPPALFTLFLLAVIAQFSWMGTRERPDLPQPEPAPPPAVEPVREPTWETATKQVPWNRLTDLRRVALDDPELPGWVWLDYPVFQEEGEGFQEINAFFQAYCDGFFSPENERLKAALEQAAQAGEDWSWTNTAGMDFSGELVSVSLSWEDGSVEGYTFRTDTGERLELSQVVRELPEELEGREDLYWYVTGGEVWGAAVGAGPAPLPVELREEYSGLPRTPELRYQTTLLEDREEGVRRVTLDPQGLALSVFYEVPLLEETGPGEEAINVFFQRLQEDFFSTDNGELTKTWAYAAYPWAPDGLYRYERRARVRTRTEKLVSVSVDYAWYMGGAASCGSDSYTFRTDTGAALRLTDVAAEGAAELRAMILAAARERDAGQGEIDLERLERYYLEDFEFYVEDGALYVAFDRYELTDGAGGGFVLKLPAALREEFR